LLAVERATNTIFIDGGTTDAVTTQIYFALDMGGERKRDRERVKGILVHCPVLLSTERPCGHVVHVIFPCVSLQ
jgi:hypothetical protein